MHDNEMHKPAAANVIAEYVRVNCFLIVFSLWVQNKLKKAQRQVQYRGVCFFKIWSKHARCMQQLESCYKTVTANFPACHSTLSQPSKTIILKSWGH